MWRYTFVGHVCEFGVQWRAVVWDHRTITLFSFRAGGSIAVLQWCSAGTNML